MTRFKNFGKGKQAENIEPLYFELYDERFDCIPELQGALLFDLVGNTTEDNGAAAAASIVGFFEKVLVEESYTRFNDLIRSKDRIVTVETLGDITGWLVEEYTNRPEKQPED